MNLYQCERYAQENGFDSVKFVAHFPTGNRECKWLDAYFGFFEIEGMNGGFVTTKQIDEMFPQLTCEITT
jgi:hypothetical protein